MDIFGIDVSAKGGTAECVRSVRKRPEPRKKVTVGRMETDRSMHGPGQAAFGIPRRKSVEIAVPPEGLDAVRTDVDYENGR